jgi:hypothetical protein
MAGTSYSSDKYYLIFFRPRYATQDFLPFREPLALAVDSADQGVELFLRGSELRRLLAGAYPQRLGGGCRHWGFLSNLDLLLIRDGTLSH